MTNLKQAALQMHKEKKGKIEIQSKVTVQDMGDLSLAYSPGVAEPCLEIKKESIRYYFYN